MRNGGAILFTLSFTLIQALSSISATAFQWKTDVNRAERLPDSTNEVLNSYHRKPSVEYTTYSYPPLDRFRTRGPIRPRPRRPRPRQHHRQNLHSNELPISLNSKEYPPNWNGGYYKYHQKGNAIVPYPGATVNLGKTRGNARAHRAKIISTVIRPGEEWKYVNDTLRPHRSKPRRVSRLRQNRSDSSYASDEPKPVKRHRKQCIMCPEERTLIANKKMDRVLFVEPTLKSCHGRVLHSRYQFKSIYGVKPGELLSVGTHVLVGEISFKNKPVQTCHLRVNVIARQCEPLLNTPDLSVECDAGHLWGSTCTYSCAKSNEVLEKGGNQVTCNDELKWSGEVPTCIRKLDSCEIPINDIHIRFMCNATEVATDSNSGIDDSRLPEGTRCRIECDSGYRSYPRGASAVCIKGDWIGNINVTCKRHRRTIHRRLN